METKIIRGDIIKDKIFNEVRTEVNLLKGETGQVPGIAFLGFNCTPLAKYNIPLHVQMAQSMGFRVLTEIMPDDAAEEDVFRVIDRLNATAEIDAVVLLQPLPDHLNPVRIVNRIDPAKEVEGFHPQNIISTMVPDIHTSRYPMCLPEALFEMFLEAEVRLPRDQEWVFVLDDGFFANTLTKMIVRAAASKVVPDDCSVTFVNRESANLVAHCRRADVLVAVSKFPEYIQPEWIKPGAIIIDIYSNLVKEVPSKADPAKLVPVIRGGVNVEAVTGIASILLPIPGGLMTVVLAILFRNTLMAFKNKLARW
jgi:methylenetetrahydrofolate dehydrogenase (NADP+)/methenyltetrahydrofolate cyclohydrolase